MATFTHKTLIKSSGFTLLEVLIAISIFAVIGLAAYRVLDIVILSQSKVAAHDDSLRSLERAMHIISADFEQLTSRPVRDNYDDQLGAFLAPHENYAVEFTRQGWRNPLQLPRSQLQRVAYELGHAPDDKDDDGTHLLRHYWTVLDRAQDSEPRTQLLLKNIDDLQISFLDSAGQWKNEWPPNQITGEAKKGLPSALLVELNSQQAGQIQRLYQLSEVSDWQASGFNINAPTGDPNNPSFSNTNKDSNSSPKNIKGYNDDDYDPDDFYEPGGQL